MSVLNDIHLRYLIEKKTVKHYPQKNETGIQVVYRIKDTINALLEKWYRHYF